VKELDQQIAPARGVAEQLAHLVDCPWLDLASLGHRAAAPPAGAGVAWLMGWP